MSLSAGAPLEADIVVVTTRFSPEPTGTALYVTDLVQELQCRQLSVIVVTGTAYYPRFQRIVTCPESEPHVVRLPTIVPRSGKSAMWRAASDLSFLFQATIWRRRIRPRLAVISVSPGSPVVFGAGRMLGGKQPHFGWTHDLQSGLARASSGRLSTIYRWGARVSERFLLRLPTHLAGLSEEMTWDITALQPRVSPTVLPLWPTLSSADLRLPWPVQSADIQYSGALGQKHGASQLLDIAKHIAEVAPQLRLRIRSEGPEATALQDRFSQAGISNTEFCDFVREDQLCAALREAPVHIVPSARGIGDAVLPSKIINALAAGCRVVAGGEPGSAVSRLARTESSLTVVGPDDPIAMADAAIAATKLGPSTQPQSPADRAAVVLMLLSALGVSIACGGISSPASDGVSEPT